jgi:hypothetical protein
MSIVTLGSAKGSPGVTTIALAVAMWWSRPMVLLEADPAGGDLAARLGLPDEPGLVGLAASLRRNPRAGARDESWIDRYGQTSQAGVRLVVAPAGSHQATTSVGLLPRLSTLPLPEGTDILVDLGRLTDSGPVADTGRFEQAGRRKDAGQPVVAGCAADKGSPVETAGTADASRFAGTYQDRESSARPLTPGTATFVWVSRPQLADLAHLAAAVDHRRHGDRAPEIVLTGDGSYPTDEVASALDVAVLGNLPADPAGAAALWAGGGRKWAHSALGRATRDLAEALAGTVGAGSHGGIDEVEAVGFSDIPPSGTEPGGECFVVAESVAGSIGSHP